MSITKTVTLRGNQAGIDARTRTSGTETILNNSTDGVVIAAPDVVVDGFTFQGLTTTGGFAEAALYIPMTGDNFQVRNNIFRDNITGLAVSSNSTVGSLVEHNLFRDNEVAGTTVGQTGLLRLPTIANVADLTVNENRFMGDHPVAAIQAVGSPAAITDVAITGNQIEDGGQIRLANLDSSSLTGNTFSGALPTPASTGPALLLRGGNANLLISDNTFTSTHLTPLPRTMLYITDDSTGFGSNTSVTFTGNTVTLNAPALPNPGFSPMLFIGSLGGTSTVSDNTVTISRPASGALSTVAGMQVENTVTGTLDITNNILQGGSAAPVEDVDASPGIAVQLTTPVTVNLTIADSTLDHWVTGLFVSAGGGLEIRGNQISASVKDGISVFSGSGAWLRDNRIVGSGDLGIDLGDDGVTPNDTGDGDSGPNERQNFPVLATAETKDGQTLVTGTLNSVASTTFHVELFSSETCNASGFGEGQTVLGGFDVTTNGSGNATFSQTLPTALANGSVVTAMATRNATRDTSEFSACRIVQPVGVTVCPTSGLTTSEAGGIAAFAVDLTSVPAANVTIELSSSNPGEATVSPTTLTFTPANALVPQIVTVTGVDDSTPDGTVAYSIVTAAATSADPFYNGLDPADVSLVNLDNDATPTPTATLTATVTTTPTVTATATVTPTPTVTATATVIACTPRPDVRIRPAVGGGALHVAVSATPLNTRENNALLELRFGDPSQGVGDPQNARIILNGQTHTERFTYAVPPGVHEVTFIVQRVVAGQPTLVPLVVKDQCGEWKTFVGGGTAAGF